GAASSLAFSNLFSPANAADPNKTGASSMYADIVLHNGFITTLDRANPNATAVAIKDGLFIDDLRIRSGECHDVAVGTHVD
ncbi:hypothetical protein ACC736_39165, partial [Rhizobium ruizarguesonis]